jgi:hypothetical protein
VRCRVSSSSRYATLRSRDEEPAAELLAARRLA